MGRYGRVAALACHVGLCKLVTAAPLTVVVVAMLVRACWWLMRLLEVFPLTSSSPRTGVACSQASVRWKTQEMSVEWAASWVVPGETFGVDSKEM